MRIVIKKAKREVDNIILTLDKMPTLKGDEIDYRLEFGLRAVDNRRIYYASVVPGSIVENLTETQKSSLSSGLEIKYGNRVLKWSKYKKAIVSLISIEDAIHRIIEERYELLNAEKQEPIEILGDLECLLK